MIINSFKIVRWLFILIILSSFINGCVKPVNLGFINIGKSGTLKEFNVDSCKIQLLITPTTVNNEYIYSVSFFNKSDLALITNAESELDIIKYPPNHLHHQRIRHQKVMIVSSLRPAFDTSAACYVYKHKFMSAGKYELILNLNKLAGKQLEKEICISFDQEVL